MLPGSTKILILAVAFAPSLAMLVAAVLLYPVVFLALLRRLVTRSAASSTIYSKESLALVACLLIFLRVSRPGAGASIMPKAAPAASAISVVIRVLLEDMKEVVSDGTSNAMPLAKAFATVRTCWGTGAAVWANVSLSITHTRHSCTTL